MIELKIVELGNNMASFTVFNEYKQVIQHFRKSKDEKKKQIEKIRTKHMKLGQSIFCNDQTISTEWSK